MHKAGFFKQLPAHQKIIPSSSYSSSNCSLSVNGAKFIGLAYTLTIFRVPLNPSLFFTQLRDPGLSFGSLTGLQRIRREFKV